MKRIILTVISTLLVLTSVFAFTSFVNFGMGYGFEFGKAFHKNNLSYIRNERYRDNMFTFSLEYQGEWENGLTVYDRANISFGRGLDLQKQDMYFSDQENLKNTAFSESLGFGYSFHPTDNLRMSLCAGPHYDFILYSESVRGEDIAEKIENFGVEVNFNTNIYLGRHLALNFTVAPCFNFINMNSSFEYDNILESGTAAGLSVLAAAGVSLKY